MGLFYIKCYKILSITVHFKIVNVHLPAHPLYL